MQRVFPGLAVAAALAVLPGAGPGQGQLTSLRIPGDIEWKRAQQLPFNPGGFFESVDFKIEDGIAPLDTARWVPLPAIPDSIVSASDFGFADRRLFDAFTRHVSRDRVLARAEVVEEGAVIVEAGGLLLSPKQDFPRTVAAVRLFRAAGIDSLRAMVNLANAVLVPIDPQLLFSNWLRSPTIYETQLTKGQEQALLEALIDADPDNSFRRVDGQNRPVRKRSVVVIMDLTRRFPVGMVRFYPRVEENPLPIAGYKLEVHDGVTVKRGKGERIAERDFLGFGGGAEASAGTVPVFEQLIIDQSNTEDTVAVRFDEPEYLQQFKFRSLTGLDFDIAEFEVFNEGFTPKAVYLGKPLPVDPAGIDAMLRYLGGDLSLRAELDLLQGGTLGRVSWDEEKIGDPSASSAVVSMQTGFTPEPWIPIRLNRNGDAVEWRPDAEVVDRRAGSPGRGEIVNLDDPLLRAGARDVWNALSDEERLVARTTFPEYNDPAIVPVANKRTRAGEVLPILPDPLFWSGFQPLMNGERAQLPGERPFFQLRVDFTSSDPGAATVIRNLRIEQLLPPLLREVRAEIVPATEVTAGLDTLFTYALRPRFGPGDPGFNRIRIPTPTRISRVRSVRFAYGLDGVERSARGPVRDRGERGGPVRHRRPQGGALDCGRGLPGGAGRVPRPRPRRQDRFHRARLPRHPRRRGGNRFRRHHHPGRRGRRRHPGDHPSAAGHGGGCPVLSRGAVRPQFPGGGDERRTAGRGGDLAGRDRPESLHSERGRNQRLGGHHLRRPARGRAGTGDHRAVRPFGTVDPQMGRGASRRQLFRDLGRQRVGRPAGAAGTLSAQAEERDRQRRLRVHPDGVGRLLRPVEWRE